MRPLRASGLLPLAPLSVFGTILACTSGSTGNNFTPVDSGGGGCNGGTTACGSACADTSKDRDNCGACGKACAAGEVCTQGKCALDCVGGTTKCGTACVDTNNDPSNCGTCGKICASGETCKTGTCTPTCTGSTTSCTGGCFDLNNDPSHCGTCSTVCPTPLNSVPICVAKSCSSICATGFLDCDGGVAGCETNGQTDDNNCGICGRKCNTGAGETCKAGTCST